MTTVFRLELDIKECESYKNRVIGRLIWSKTKPNLISLSAARLGRVREESSDQAPQPHADGLSALLLFYWQFIIRENKHDQA